MRVYTQIALSDDEGRQVPSARIVDLADAENALALGNVVPLKQLDAETLKRAEQLEADEAERAAKVRRRRQAVETGEAPDADENAALVVGAPKGRGKAAAARK